jgi:hypothetical protein
MTQQYKRLKANPLWSYIECRRSPIHGYGNKVNDGGGGGGVKQFMFWGPMRGGRVGVK